MRKFICYLIGIFLLLFQTVMVDAACPSAPDPLPPLPLPLVVPPPHSTCSTPTPPSQTGYLPITIVNNSNLSADEVRWLAKTGQKNRGNKVRFTAVN